MLKNILPATVLLGLLGLGPAHSQEIKDINVAAIMPLSGSSMVNNGPASKAIKMRVNEINKNGFDVGGTKYRFNVSWFDSECKSTSAVKATRAALDTMKDIDVIWVGMCSSGAVASRPLLIDSGYVVLNSVSGTSQFSGPKGDPYLFKIKETFYGRDVSLSEYLKKMGHKKGVVVAVNSKWGAESSSTFKKAAEDEGLEVTDIITYDEENEEFAPIITKLKKIDPDFVFQSSEYINEQVSFLRTYRQYGLKAQLAGESTWTEDIPAKMGWDAIDGMLVAGAWFPGSDSPEVKKFLADYEKEYGEIPGFNGPTSYDMVNITVEAYQKAGKVDPKALRDVLRTSKFTGMTYGDGVLNFDDNGQAQFKTVVTRFDKNKKARVHAE